MNRKWLIALTVVVVSVSLSACGGGGNESPASDGADQTAGTGGNEVPAEARADGQSFVGWLKTFLADTDLQGEPIKVDGGGVLVDESAEPRVL